MVGETLHALWTLGFGPGGHSVRKMGGCSVARVLVVDDEAGYRRNLERIASREGHDVQATSCARSALDVARDFSPDVLIVDWMLAGAVNGLELARRLQADQNDLVVLLISGYPSAQLEQNPQEQGVFEFLSKPFELSHVQDALRRAVN